MTNEQLKAIEARAAKAAEGPWGVWNGTDIFPIDDVKGEKQIADCDVGEMAEDIDNYTEQRANANLIANAPTDIANLCAALRAAQAETEQAWAIAKDNRERRIKAEDAQTVAESWWRYHAEGHAQKFDEAERLAAEASAETVENVNLAMENERLRHAIESAMSSLEKASGTVGRPKSIGISKVFDVYCALKEALRDD
jgi:hypothetical protein